MKWAYLFDFDSSITFNSSSIHSSLKLLNYLIHFFDCLEDLSNPAYFVWNEVNSLDDFYLLTSYEPNAYDLKETYVDSYTESLTQPQFSEHGFLDDVEYEDTALEDIFHETHRVHFNHSQRKGMPVGQSSSSMSERTGRSVGEGTGRLVRSSRQELHVKNAQIRTLLDKHEEQIFAARRKLKITNFRLIMTKDVFENYVKLLNVSKKNFTAFKLKNFNDEINNFFMNCYFSKIEWRETHNQSFDEMEELNKFQNSFRHYCKTKISPGRGHYPWTPWRDTRIAEWNEFYEWFKKFPGCWINPHWKFTHYLSTSVIHTP